MPDIRDPRFDGMLGQPIQPPPQVKPVVVLNTPQGPQPFPAEVALVIVLQEVANRLGEIRDALKVGGPKVLAPGEPDGGLRSD
jgi:hypothetical protein